MLLGAQWYVLFNVLAGASADARTTSTKRPPFIAMSGSDRWRKLFVPAVFPYPRDGPRDGGRRRLERLDRRRDA